jgi:hypothetical protein
VRCSALLVFEMENNRRSFALLRMTAIDINAGPSTPVASLWSLRMTAFVRAGGIERDCVALVIFQEFLGGDCGGESSASLRAPAVRPTAFGVTG